MRQGIIRPFTRDACEDVSQRKVRRKRPAKVQKEFGRQIMWSVQLAGQFQPYDAAANSKIETAFQAGSQHAKIDLRGQRYIISFQPPDAMRQKLESDPSRTRPVRREAPAPSPPAAAPVPPIAPAAPAAPPAPAPPAPAPPAPPVPPTKRKDPAAVDAATSKRAKGDPGKKADAPAASSSAPAPAAAVDLAGDGGGGAGTSGSGAAGAAGTPSAGADPSTNNQRIEAMLLELAETEKVKGDNVRAGVYFKAAKAVREHPTPITDGKKAAKELKGVGKKIAEKIDELLSTGTLARLERERGDAGTSSLRQLQRVSGIGIKAAEALQAKGIMDLLTLRARAEAEPTLLTHEQTLGLTHLEDFESRIPRAEMLRLEAAVRRAAEAHSPPLDMTVCGSFRRGKAFSGDVDVLLTHPSFARVPEDGDAAGTPGWLSTLVAALKASGLVTAVIALGAKKAACVCRLSDDEWRSLQQPTAPPALPVTALPATALPAPMEVESAGAVSEGSGEAGGEGSAVTDCGQLGDCLRRSLSSREAMCGGSPPASAAGLRTGRASLDEDGGTEDEDTIVSKLADAATGGSGGTSGGDSGGSDRGSASASPLSVPSAAARSAAAPLAAAPSAAAPLAAAPSVDAAPSVGALPSVPLPAFQQLLAKKKAALAQGGHGRRDLFPQWQARRTGEPGVATGAPAASAVVATGTEICGGGGGGGDSGGSSGGDGGRGPIAAAAAPVPFKEMRKAAGKLAASAAAHAGASECAGPAHVASASFDVAGFSGGFDVGVGTSGPRYRRLDLRLVPCESYAASVLYFTGSDEHNKSMRSVAIAKGMKLSEYGLFTVRKGADGKLVEEPLPGLYTEQAIFEALGMAYKAPPERDL